MLQIRILTWLFIFFVKQIGVQVYIMIVSWYFLQQLIMEDWHKFFSFHSRFSV